MKNTLSFLTITIGSLMYTRVKRSLLPSRFWDALENFLLQLGADQAIAKLRKFENRKQNNTYEVHTLLQHVEVNRFIICFYSFSRFLTESPRVIIYDDGTLTSKDVDLLESIRGLKVVSYPSIEMRFRSYFDDKRILAKYRKSAIRTRKVIDILFLSSGRPKIMILDSDVGFFAKPELILRFLANQESKEKMIYMSDIQDAYATSAKNLQTIFKINVRSKLNCGLLCFDSKILTKKFITDVFTQLSKFEKKYEYKEYWIDQTPWAVLATKVNSLRLPQSYVIGMSDTPDNTVCRHYVHGSRFYFIKDILMLIY